MKYYCIAVNLCQPNKELSIHNSRLPNAHSHPISDGATFSIFQKFNSITFNFTELSGHNMKGVVPKLLLKIKICLDIKKTLLPRTDKSLQQVFIMEKRRTAHSNRSKVRAN